ncbi:hypothetical protein K1719_014111 [Acacia pycnantha]|nr:hypothetical protein K1719_014111 [Acacia pycnantha]
MGLPFGGKGIEVKLSEQNPTFRDFRRAYKNVKYKTLGDTLSEKLDEHFEYLFVLFTLGTLLAPSASIYVSDRMLKVVTLTKDALGEFDWSSFILEELSQQIHEFNKDSHKSMGNKRKTVGGCVYFLMVASNTSRPWLIGPTAGLRAESDLWRKQEKKAARSPLVLDHQTLRRHRLTLTRCSLTRDATLQDRLIESPNNQPSSSKRECEEENEKERDEEDDEERDDEKEIEDEDDHIVDIDDDDDHHHDTPIVQHAYGLHVEPI